MKNIKLIIFTMFCFLIATPKVFANNFSITTSGTWNYGKNYDVTIKYSGEKLGSVRLNASMTNANCSVKSVHPSGTRKCTGSSCDVAYTDPNGIASGSTLLVLTCQPNQTATKVILSARLENGDAWDLDGLNQINISPASKTITVTGTTSTTTTTKKPTTTTTRRPTTKTTTTKKVTTTTTTKKVTTGPTRPIDDKTTTTTRPTTTLPWITDPTTSTTSTTTTTTTTEVPIIVPEDMKLSSLQIVGYNIKFKPNCTSYDITVDPSVSELYVIAKPIDSLTKVTNTGIIDITNKDRITIRVYNELSHNHIEYTIRINNEEVDESTLEILVNNSKLFLLFSALLFVIIIMVIGALRKPKVKLEKVDNATIAIENETVNVESATDKDFMEIPETEEELTKVFTNMNNREN